MTDPLADSTPDGTPIAPASDAKERKFSNPLPPLAIASASVAKDGSFSAPSPSPAPSPRGPPSPRGQEGPLSVPAPAPVGKERKFSNPLPPLAITPVPATPVKESGPSTPVPPPSITPAPVPVAPLAPAEDPTPVTPSRRRSATLASAIPPRWRAAACAAAGQRRYWALLLVIISLCYYGSYVRYGINFHDEGGTVALIGKRLLDGERPFHDVVLGYNVLWFYPIVGLFKLFGVNFVLLRAYCFFLSTVTVLLGFLLLERATRRAWLAFLVALLLVIVPGMTFKNYMPLLAVGNILCLASFLLRRAESPIAALEPVADPTPVPVPPEYSWKKVAAGGFVLGCSFLIRIDVGMFFALIWLGVLLLTALEPRVPARKRWSRIFLAPLLLVAMAFLPHLPVLADAAHRGFSEQFTAQYLAWPKMIVSSLKERVGSKNAPTSIPGKRVATVAPPAAVTARVAVSNPGVVQDPGVNDQAKNRGTLRRRTWTDILHPTSQKAQLLAILLYAPLVSLLPLVICAFIQLLVAYRSGTSGGIRRPLAALAILGGALTVFPQYFFFRPDSPHLSEFSPSFWVASVAAIFLLWGRPSLGRLRLALPGTILLCWLTLHASIFLWRMVPDRWTGTIAARFKRTQMFPGENGVDVYLTKTEFKGLTALVKVIRAHSAPGEYLVAYPYHPAVNLLVDRPTYEKNMYIDNATRSANWDAQAIGRIVKYTPAVIVLSDWEINGTEASRFSVWAAKTTAWIQAHYDFQGIFMDREKFSIYTRRNTPGDPPLPVLPAPE